MARTNHLPVGELTGYQAPTPTSLGVSWKKKKNHLKEGAATLLLAPSKSSRCCLPETSDLHGLKRKNNGCATRIRYDTVLTYHQCIRCMMHVPLFASRTTSVRGVHCSRYLHPAISPGWGGPVPGMAFRPGMTHAIPTCCQFASMQDHLCPSCPL